MFIWKDTKKRCNIHATPYTAEDGTRYGVMPMVLVEEIPDPQPPDDYSDETYYRTEQDDAPYVVYTKKPDEQILAVWRNKVKQQRDDLIDNGGCFVQGKWFHSDVKSKQQQVVLKMLGAALPTGLQWKTMDGTFVTMTQSLISDIFAAQIARETAIFAIAEAAASAPFEPIAWPGRYIPL